MIFNSTTDMIGKDEWGAATLQVGRETIYGFNPVLWSFREAQEFRGAMTLPEMARLWLETEKTHHWDDWAGPEQIDHARKVLARIAASVDAPTGGDRG